MKVFVRAPYPENRLAELREMFDEVVYEPWNATGERYYEDEMLEHLLKEQPDVLITEPPTAEDLKFLDCPNTIVTPHMCGATYEVTNHQADILNARLHQWLAGENLQKIVYNKDVLA